MKTKKRKPAKTKAGRARSSPSRRAPAARRRASPAATASGAKSNGVREPRVSPDGELDTILNEVTVTSERRRRENWLSVSCPYCGENFEIRTESEEDGQSLYQDCQVCCKPISIFIQIDEDGETHVNVARS